MGRGHAAAYETCSWRPGLIRQRWGSQALAATPVGFLRIVGVVLYWFLSRIAATERAKARLWQRQTSKYGAIVSRPSPAHPDALRAPLNRVMPHIVGPPVDQEEGPPSSQEAP